MSCLLLCSAFQTRHRDRFLTNLWCMHRTDADTLPDCVYSTYLWHMVIGTDRGIVVRIYLFIYCGICEFHTHTGMSAWAGFCQWSNNNQQRGNKWSGALSEKIVYKGGPSGLMLLSADSHVENSLNSKQSWGTTIILEQQDAVKIPNDWWE